LGEDIDEVFLIDAAEVINSRPGRWLRLALSDAEAASKLDLRGIDRLDTSSHTSVPNRAEDKQLDQEELLALAMEAQRLDQLLATNPEMDALLGALDGNHVPSGYGGDPVRNPDSLPTGRNLYGFDPVRVPTAQSWKIGVGVLDNWVADYRAQHDGAFPTQIAFTLWAGETMRHHGIMESQIFSALGVKPKWDTSGRMKGFKIIPIEELGRPRIDVLANVTGSYRDQFPHLMQWINKAVVAVAELAPASGKTESEADHANYVAEHVQALREELMQEGLDSDLASRQATARVFSNASGTYGTGLNNAVYHSDLWDSQQRGGGDAEMSELFLSRMGHAYGEGLEGVEASQLFAKQVGNLDAVFLARSSNTYGVLTSDDPFAYLGGFSLASRATGGKTPELVVQNLRDPSEVILDPAATAIAKEMQTRYLAPQWIRAQQQEGYSGTLQVLKATEFLWGWQAIAPETVREDQWESIMDVYLEDQYELGTREWLERSNHQALAQIAERMLESVRLGYWSPSRKDQQKLAQIYTAAREQSGLKELNPKTVTFVSGLLPDASAKEASESLVGNTKPTIDQSGKTATAASPEQAPKNSDLAESTRVEGLELKPSNAPPGEDSKGIESPKRYAVYTAVAVLLLILSGALARIVRSSTKQA
ncbi:MAG: cobaltochelatase subunit CobN, partial [Planctomycetota bacterium]